MDLVAGAKQVWVMLSSHVSKDGSPKVVDACTLPLTGVRCVNRIYSDLAIIEVTADGFVVTGLVEGLSLDALQQQTGAPLRASPDLRVLHASHAA